MHDELDPPAGQDQGPVMWLPSEPILVCGSPATRSGRFCRWDLTEGPCPLHAASSSSAAAPAADPLAPFGEDLRHEIRRTVCRSCGAEAEGLCRRPDGALAWRPHRARVKDAREALKIARVLADDRWSGRRSPESD